VHDTTRVVLIALAAALLVAVLLPALYMSAMMGSMGATMRGGMMSGAIVWWFWLPVLVLVAGGIALAVGLRKHA
jgi:hypothetical protein